MALNEPPWGDRLSRHLKVALGASKVQIQALSVLAGGAIQENWALDLVVTGGPHEGTKHWVLRTDSSSQIDASWPREQEFAILSAAHRIGVAVPAPILLCQDPSVMIKSFCIMQRISGDARGHRLVRDRSVLENGDRIVGQLGEELAKLHRIRPGAVELDFIPVPALHPALARIETLHRFLLKHAQPQPVIELALRWLACNMPTADDVCLIHGDLRTGNFLVEEGRLQAILDWEFAAFSDPLEDLGWLLARCWRFGGYGREAGGIGSANALIAAYEHAVGRRIDRVHLPYWQLMATARWAVIALDQAARAYNQGEPSLELALTAEVLPSLEWDMLDLMDRMDAGDRCLLF